MEEHPAAPRALLFEGSDRARVHVGDRTWEDVPLVPLAKDEHEPIGLDEPALVLRAGSPTATARLLGERHDDVVIFLARISPDDGSMSEMRVRVRDLHERKAGGEKLWNRMFRKKNA